MPSLSLEGRTLHYREAGAGLPLLLLHAFPLHGASFHRQVTALSHFCRVIVPDLRGFGESTLGAGPTHMEDVAHDAVALLDALNIHTAVVGGVSMGGYAAMAMLREDAGRVRGLVLADTQLSADDEEGRARRERSALEAEENGIEPLIASLLPKLLSTGPDSAVGREVEALMRQASPQSVAAAQRGMALRYDSRDILARYAGPTLILVGEADAITPVEKAEQMAALIPGAQLERIPSAGHLANQEAPAAFNAALEAFLEKL